MQAIFGIINYNPKQITCVFTSYDRLHHLFGLLRNYTPTANKSQHKKKRKLKNIIMFQNRIIKGSMLVFLTDFKPEKPEKRPHLTEIQPLIIMLVAARNYAVLSVTGNLTEMNL